jgi:ubiquitin
MPIDKTKCCKTHTEEKEESGECCQLEDQQKAEQATYEHTVRLNEEKHE